MFYRKNRKYLEIFMRFFLGVFVLLFTLCSNSSFSAVNENSFKSYFYFDKKIAYLQFHFFNPDCIFGVLIIPSQVTPNNYTVLATNTYFLDDMPSRPMSTIFLEKDKVISRSYEPFECIRFYPDPIVKGKKWKNPLGTDNRDICTTIEKTGVSIYLGSKIYRNCIKIRSESLLTDESDKEIFLREYTFLAKNLGIVKKATYSFYKKKPEVHGYELQLVRYYPDAVTTENIKRIFKEIQVEEKAKFDAGQ
ncbi:MAG: hypothetical protein EBZ47_09365, partial [Chlamydiae bacterium]|nr:hypothetical protein [Chlamydiota bacterium]